VLVLAPAFAALVTLALLWPTSGIDRAPPECYAFPGYVVPCATSFAVAGALAAAACVTLGILVGHRRATARGRTG
jgi:hypothetical protein